jgi:SAM-dependent methyltransferase
MAIADGTIRKLIPAVPALSRVRTLMVPLDLIDRVLSSPYREFRDLPPNHMRIRVGVGNRILFNAALFRTMPIAFWMDVLERGIVRLNSRIVDLGCGCGRYAITLRDMLCHDRRFSGHYMGVDVDAEMLNWCRAHFPPDRFTFHRVDTYSRTYNPNSAQTPAAASVGNNGAAVAATPATPAENFPSLQLSLESSSQDFVFANSLFSHLLEEQFRDYLRESARVLGPEGCLQFSVFCLEHVGRGPGSRWSFRHTSGAAYVENLKYPEAAVAYTRSWLETACRQAGFSQVEILPSAGQTIMRCRK